MIFTAGARVGTSLRVGEHHRIAKRRGMVGRVVGRYGGEEYLAVEVRFSGGERRPFRPEDLEEVTSPRPWRRRVLLGRSGQR